MKNLQIASLKVIFGMTVEIDRVGINYRLGSSWKKTEPSLVSFTGEKALEQAKLAEMSVFNCKNRRVN